MKITDAHVDLADIFFEFGLSIDDFFSDRKDIPVSLKLLREADIGVIGLTLFFDKYLLKQKSMFEEVFGYLDFYKEIFSKTNLFKHLLSSKDFDTIKNDEIGFFYSIEGFECIRSNEDLELFYNEGVRSFGLSWVGQNQYFTGNGEDEDIGITSNGKDILKKMSQMKLIVDTAHLSSNSFKDLRKYYSGRIVNTHANVKAISDTVHNLSDDQIQSIVDSGGIVCVFPIAEDVGGKATFADLYNHIDYIASKWGAQYVGVSSDIYPLPEYPFINNAQNILIIKEFRDYLLSRLSEEVVENITYNDFNNVLKSALN